MGCARDYLCDLYVRECMDIYFLGKALQKRWPPTSGHELKHLPSPNQSINKELNPTTRTHKGKKHYNQQCERQMLKKTRWSAHCRRRVLARPGYQQKLISLPKTLSSLRRQIFFNKSEQTRAQVQKQTTSYYMLYCCLVVMIASLFSSS